MKTRDCQECANSEFKETGKIARSIIVEWDKQPETRLFCNLKNKFIRFYLPKDFRELSCNGGSWKAKCNEFLCK